MSAVKPDSRRKFLRQSATAAAGASLFHIVPSTVFGSQDRPAPSDRLNIGHIGLGGRGRRFLRPAISATDRVLQDPNLGGRGERYLRPSQSIALCDVDSNRLDEAASKIGGKPRLYKDFRRLLEQRDIDAVFIASPDHWHALMTIMACQAGKDVFVEKPACNTIEEGRAMVVAAERYGRVVQVGSQGRSQDAAWHACKYVRNGQVGTVRKVTCWHYENPLGDWTPNAEPPPHLDYDAWLGPAQWVPYNERRTHGRFRWMLDFGGGQIRDRGAHVMSIAMWIMNQDHTGPVKVTATGDPYPDGMYDSPRNMTVTYEFKNPDWTLLWAQPGETPPELPAKYGAKYWGDNGSVVVTYGDGQPTDTEDKAKRYQVPCGGVEVYRSPGHAEDFEDCIKTRNKPIMHIEAGHRVASLCILGNIAYALGRPLEWDPVSERVRDDEEANRLLSRPGRGQWHL